MTDVQPSPLIPGRAASATVNGRAASNGQPKATEEVTAASLKDLVATASRDLSTLVRKEIELAKAELQITMIGVVKGVAPLLGALVFVLGGAILLVFAVAEAFNEIIPRPYAFLAGAGALFLIAALAALLGKSLLGRVQKPERSPVTVKDSIAWAKNPTKPAQLSHPTSAESTS